MEVCALSFNQGLAVALNEGLKHCRYDWVARMDSDDIALPDRFAMQSEYLSKHPDVDVLGACIEERDIDMQRVLGWRRVPSGHVDIAHFARRRNPISHPVVVFRKAAVLEVGGYPVLRRAQDYALWSLLLMRGYRFANQTQCLLWMRTGDGLMARRDYQYFLSELDLLRFQYGIGFLSCADYLINFGGRFMLRVMPNRLKRLVYDVAR
jgi:amylovoran biosynthesis glycosyltransferase AmsE